METNDFRRYYDYIEFDVDNDSIRLSKATQGDVKSRGFYIKIMQAGEQIIPELNEQMVFLATKPDGLPIVEVAELQDDSLFRIDLPAQMFTVDGMAKCQLTYEGVAGQAISTQLFRMAISKGLMATSIVSTAERGFIGEVLDAKYTLLPELRNIRTMIEKTEVNEKNRIASEIIRSDNENQRIASHKDILLKVENGVKGLKGDDGYTPVKNVDYFDGEKGEKGEAGTSNVTKETIVEAIGYEPVDKLDVGNLADLKTQALTIVEAINNKIGIQDVRYYKPTLYNGASTVVGLPDVSYYKNEIGEVVLGSCIRNVKNSALSFRLPIGFRPSGHLWFAMATNDPAFTGTVHIYPDGDVAMSIEVGYYHASLDNVRFKAVKV